MKPPKHLPFWAGPSPHEGMPRVSGEFCGEGAPRTRRWKGSDSSPPPEEHPLMSPRSFVLPRRKSRGDPRLRTRLQSGQAIVREGGKRTMIRLLAQVFSLKEPILSLRGDRLTYTDSSPPEPKTSYGTAPGPDPATDATSRTRSVREGPSPRKGNTPGFRRTSRHNGSAHTCLMGANCALPHVEHPPDEPGEFLLPAP